MTTSCNLPQLPIPWNWHLDTKSEPETWVARRPPSANGSVGHAEVALVRDLIEIYEETTNIPSAPLSVIFAVVSANLSTVSL